VEGPAVSRRVPQVSWFPRPGLGARRCGPALSSQNKLRTENREPATDNRFSSRLSPGLLVCPPDYSPRITPGRLGRLVRPHPALELLGKWRL
jgi:hypothetical protein